MNGRLAAATASASAGRGRLGGHLLVQLAAWFALAGCATSPSTVPVAASASNAARATTIAAPRNATGSPQADKLASLQAWARNSGYQPYSKEGKPFWCKNEALLGSHLGRVHCVPEDALADLERQSLDSQQSLSERERVCAGGDCNKSR